MKVHWWKERKRVIHQLLSHVLQNKHIRLFKFIQLLRSCFGRTISQNTVLKKSSHLNFRLLFQAHHQVSRLQSENSGHYNDRDHNKLLSSLKHFMFWIRVLTLLHGEIEILLSAPRSDLVAHCFFFSLFFFFKCWYFYIPIYRMCSLDISEFFFIHLWVMDPYSTHTEEDESYKDRTFS